MPFKYCKKITIDHTKVEADLTGYPFLFSSTDSKFKTVANGGRIQNTALGGANGTVTVPADLVFSPNPDGSSKYDFEIEKYVPTTGELIAHIRLPAPSAVQDTVLYVAYGDPLVTTSQENVTAVWDANFKGVWHLQQTSGVYADSTANDNDSTTVQVTSRTASGKIDGCPEFDGSDDYIERTNTPSLAITGDLTIEAWVKADAFVDGKLQCIVTKDQVDKQRAYELHTSWDSPTQKTFYFYIFKSVSVSTAVATYTRLSTGTWYYVVAVYDYISDGNSKMRVYLNGVQDVGENPNAVGPMPNTTSPLQIGKRPWPGDPGVWDGLIDEVRVSASVRSAAYILTTYNNQSDPAAFYTLGGEVGLLARSYSFIV